MGGFNSQREFAPEKEMVPPALSPAHGSGYKGVLSVTLPRDAEVNHMCVFGSKMRAGTFMNVYQPKYRISDQEFILRA